MGDLSSSPVEVDSGWGGGNVIDRLGTGAPDISFGGDTSSLSDPSSSAGEDFLLAGSRSALVDSEDGDFKRLFRRDLELCFFLALDLLPFFELFEAFAALAALAFFFNIELESVLSAGRFRSVCDVILV